MSTIQHRRAPRAGLALVALLVGLAALLVQPVAAHAAQNSVTIVKTRGEQDTAGTPLAGITFRLNRILDVDATSPQEVAALVASQPAVLTEDPGHPLGEDVDITTGAQGTATATGLDDGVYLVRELPHREGDVAWSVATPFLVALPMSGQDPVIYVKNQPLTVGVEIRPTQVSPGQDVEVTLTGSVPAPDVRGMLYRYALSARLHRAMGLAGVGRVSIEGLEGSDQLVAGRDYTVRIDEATNSAIVELTPAGLRLLAQRRAGHPEVRVVVRMAATVGDGVGDGAELWVRANLFTDGWPIPEFPFDASDGGATDTARVLVVAEDCPECTPAPTPVPSTTAVPSLSTAPAPCPECTPCPDCAPAPTPAASSPATVPCPECSALPSTGPGGILARTGAALSRGLLVLGAALVVGGLWLLLARRRREDEEEPADTTEPAQPPAAGAQHPDQHDPEHRRTNR